MKKLLTLLLLSPLAFAEEPLDCTDPVTQFVKPEICSKVDKSFNEKEDVIYSCLAITSLFYHRLKDSTDKDKLESGWAEESLQKTLHQMYNVYLYSLLNANAYEKNLKPLIPSAETSKYINKKYEEYLDKFISVDWKSSDRLSDCLTHAPTIFKSDKKKYELTAIEKDIWIDALQKRDSENKVDGIDIELWVENTKPLRNKKYNAERWDYWMTKSLVMSAYSNEEGKIAGIPAFEYAKQNYCMEIYGNFDCKE